MFLKKSLAVSAPLSSNGVLRNFFSFKNTKLVEKSVRIRNFFEVDPIFPDKKDEDVKLYKDKERFQYGLNQTADRNALSRHQSHFIRRIEQSLEREVKIKKLQGLKNKKLKEEIQTMQENIFLDEETKLPFGIGLDDYIELIKEESITTRTGQFYNTLEVICRKIGVFDDIELIKLYQFVLAEQASSHFQAEARSFLLKRLLQEMRALGWNTPAAKERLQKYAPASEFAAASSADSEAFAQTILPQIDSRLVNQEASQMALDNLHGKIRFNTNLKKVKAPPKRIDQDDPFFSEESDSETIGGPMLNFNNTEASASDYINQFSPIGRKVLQENQIWSKVKRNYYENKRAYYKDKMYTEEDRSKEVITKDSTLNLVDFLLDSKDDLEIKNILSKYNLVEEAIPKPEFKEILNNIDYLVDNASTSLKVQIAKQNNTNPNLYFRGNFLNENLKPEDLMWSAFQKNFLAIFPESVQEQDNTQSMTKSINDIRHYPKEYDIFEMGTNSQKDTEKKRHTERDLSHDNRVELEIYRRQKQDPFFRHYVQNEVKYFTERVNEDFMDIAQGLVPSDRKDNSMSYYDPTIEDIPNDLIDDEELRMKYQQIKEEHSEGVRIFGAGKRKTSSCLVVIKEGTGKVFVNGELFYHYFPHPYNRNIALKPLFLSTQYCEYDIHYHVHGGGVMAQSHACQVALSRGLLQLHPNLRPLFMKLDMLRTDYRQKERKKTGKYKARKSHTYVRR